MAIQEASKQEFNRLVTVIDGLGSSATRRKINLIRSAAEAFGAMNGWTLTKDFGWEPLARNVKPMRSPPFGSPRFQKHYDDLRAPHDACDHAFYYKDAEGRAAAIAVHLYGWGDAKRQAVTEWADRKGVVWEAPEITSWWFPAGTTMILYRPKASIAA